MNILIVKHPVQKITHSSCGLFLLYFYKNILKIYIVKYIVKLSIMKL